MDNTAGSGPATPAYRTRRRLTCALTALLPGADALVSQNTAIDAKLIEAAPRLKLIQRYGTRPDGIDVDTARARGVAVATMPLHGCIAVAELAMTLILSLSKKLVSAHEATTTGAYRNLGSSRCSPTSANTNSSG